MKKLRILIIGILTILLFSTISNAATWTVTKSANSNDGVCNADCSLREAVAAANPGDTVVFMNLSGQSFPLGGEEISITKSIMINGFINNGYVARILGESTSRIFHIQPGVSLTLKNMRLNAGNGKEFAEDPNNSNGGAIYGEQNANLSLDRVDISHNKAKFSGGVYLSGGTHHFTNTSFTGNSAESNTAIALYSGATLYMSNTSVSRNFVFSNNPQVFGGGAILLQGANLIMRNSTVADNSARNGGGIAVVIAAMANTINVGNSIVASNTAAEIGQDIYANPQLTITSAGGNLIGSTFQIPAGTFTQPNDITGVNPLLAPLDSRDGGYPVLTNPLQAGSRARNGGLNQNAIDPLTNQPLTFDARGTGFTRIRDTTVDIGAFEDETDNTSLIVSKNADSNDFVCDTDCSLREAVYQASLNFGTETIRFEPNSQGDFTTGGSEIVIQNQNVNIIAYQNFYAGYLTLSGGNTNRIFRLNNATVKLSGLTLAGGNAGAGFGGAVAAENGSNLTLDNVIVSNNFAAAYGAIYLSGGTHHIVNSTINNNSANTGLAIGVSGTLNMANTTVSTNFDADGGTGIGAVYVTGTANVRNSTIAFNRTPGGTGGGIFSSGTLNIGNSIVAGNIAATSPDIHRSSGAITSVGGNLVQNTNGFPMGTFSQTNDQTDVDPLLGALLNVGFPYNNGNVPTYPLMPGSPALNSGLNTQAVDPFDSSVLTTDARGGGFARIVSVVDKGSFETLAPTAASVSISGRVTNGKRGSARTRVYLTGQNGATRTAITNSFGYFSFSEVQSGETYIVNVVSKSYTFTPRVISVNDDLTDLDFSAEPNELLK